MLFFLRVYVTVEALKLGCQAARRPKERLHLILGSSVVYNVFFPLLPTRADEFFSHTSQSEQKIPKLFLVGLMVSSSYLLSYEQTKI